MDVDWSSIEDVCEKRAVALEKNDASNRPALDDIGSLVHEDNCWLGKNYVNQPDKRKLGCDRDCIKKAVARRRSGE